jgi:hypothetical protein
MEANLKELDSIKYGMIFTKYSVFVLSICFIILELFYGQGSDCNKKTCILQTFLWGAWILTSCSFLSFGILPVIILRNKIIASWYFFYLIFFGIAFFVFVQ